MVVKINPKMSNTSRSFLGKTLQGYTVDLAVNATNFGTTEMGPNGAFQQVLATIAKNCTIVMHSALRADGDSNAGQVFDIVVEGEFPTDTYDGTNAETFAVHLRDEIRTLTAAGARSAATIAVSGESANVAGVSLANATVTEMTGSPFFA